MLCNNQNILRCAAIRPAACILFAAWVWFRPAGAAQAASDATAAKAAPGVLTEDTNSPIDPFAYYRLPKDNDAFVPAADASVPLGIAVLAILELNAGDAYAALRIPGRADAVYVQQDDVVRVEMNEASADKPRPPVYLKIRNIDAHGVEISPVEHPSEVHVFQ